MEETVNRGEGRVWRTLHDGDPRDSTSVPVMLR